MTTRNNETVQNEGSRKRIIQIKARHLKIAYQTARTLWFRFTLSDNEDTISPTFTHCYRLDQSISVLWAVGRYITFVFKF